MASDLITLVCHDSEGWAEMMHGVSDKVIEPTTLALIMVFRVFQDILTRVAERLAV